MKYESISCVVLNTTYEPISIVPSKRALVLISKGKAVVVEEHPHLEIRSEKLVFKVPLMVVLKAYVRGKRMFNTPATLTNKNLFTRDKQTCQYCKRHSSELKRNEILTRDHVVPLDKGGKNVWENVITSCSTCNNKKSNYHLAETTLVLHKKPMVPTMFELWMKMYQAKAARLRESQLTT